MICKQSLGFFMHIPCKQALNALASLFDTFKSAGYNKFALEVGSLIQLNTLNSKNFTYALITIPHFNYNYLLQTFSGQNIESLVAPWWVFVACFENSSNSTPAELLFSCLQLRCFCTCFWQPCNPNGAWSSTSWIQQSLKRGCTIKLLFA